MYPEHVCIPVAAWHTMYSKRESRFCISCSFTLWWRWQYIQQHWLAAAKQLIVNLYCHQQQFTLLAHTPERLMIFSSILSQTTTTPQPFYGPFFGTPGVAGARRELLDFMVQGQINRSRHTDHPVGHHSIRTNQCPPPPSSHFLQCGCPSCHPTNSVKALKATSAFRLWRRC